VRTGANTRRYRTAFGVRGLHQVKLTVAGFELDRKKLITIGLVVLGCVALGLLYGKIDVAEVHRRADSINGGLVFALMVILPLIGFPVTVTHAVAGMRFGLGLGFALAAASIILQMLISFALVKSAPKLFARRLDGLRKRLPKGAYMPVTLFTILIPGVPYFAKNYVLPLIGVPLRTFLLWGAPIHIARSLVGIAFGHMSDDLTPLRITAFVVYFIAVTGACAWAFRRVQVQVRGQRSAAGDRKQPA
jgi:uncharacterized membrane protein YdjX (TVP38/TMEM64 family)